MPLTQPEWFPDLEAWWLPAVGDTVARHVEPVGIDGSGRLHLQCSSSAWRTQTRLLGAAFTAQVNEVLAPAAQISGILV
ncbi:DciA family protein [Streptomyces hygroscopicus]|uniref:DciA family protein n=1 Tax=Streptomyces hygroscopicus TaxID=1912 RepID=UPI0009A06232|nr:DciA family protein [Streptomyces hygroscopicus]